MQYFNIQVASQLSGVASATIRAWEKRYNAVVPERGDNKHRLYSEKDIEKLTLLFHLTDAGQSIGKIAHLEVSELKDVYATVMQKPFNGQRIANNSVGDVDYDKILNGFYIALAAYKIDIISHEFEKARAILSPKDLCLNLLVPLFREIGKKVERGELNIAQEHTLSALVSFHIGQSIGQHYQNKALRKELIIISTPEGELHELGILASALLCVHHNIKFIFMGSSLPSASIAEAANALEASAVLLGVTRQDMTDSRALENYLNDLSGRLKKSAIWVGGNLKSLTQSNLEKKKIPFFLSLHALDEFLEKF